ncbi:hypothetical protein J1N35_000536 [Gossypium stocksii]|uniref:Uncharacterized protein n=1 Tax=Gossypium stocksii TaxID=47602 RepID=A0A9D3WIK5_9ROSI|nr:hypothetical protein J1N35_000536 [Gossypium stocksii]
MLGSGVCYFFYWLSLMLEWSFYYSCVVALLSKALVAVVIAVTFLFIGFIESYNFKQIAKFSGSLILDGGGLCGLCCCFSLVPFVVMGAQDVHDGESDDDDDDDGDDGESNNSSGDML